MKTIFFYLALVIPFAIYGQSDTVNKTDTMRIKRETPIPKMFDGNGYAKLYANGQKILKDGEFKNYELFDGKHYIYNDQGILLRIALYKEGKHVGDAPME